MPEPSKQDVSKSAAFIYIESVISALSGYLLWLILSKITTAEVIGTASTVISISTIVITVVTLGIPNSIPRFLGKSYSEGKMKVARVFIDASLGIISLCIVVATIILLASKGLWLLGSFDPILIIMTLVLTGASAIALFLRYVVIGSLQTSTLVIREIIYSSAKLILSFFLVTLGLGSIGLTVGYTVGQILAAVLLATATFKIYKTRQDDRDRIGYRVASFEVVKAGFPSWVPALITTIGSQLGTIVVYSSHGAQTAGAYFIAFAIANGITSLTYSLLSSTFPALSAMKDGRKRFAWQLTKISLILSVPLSTSLIFYSNQIMGIFGKDYVTGSSSLAILLFSILPVTVMTGINILVYAYGDYKKVLLIGLATSLPRIILYFILVPLYGIDGTALSFTLGSIAGFVVSIILARVISFKLYWKDLILIFSIPLLIGLFLKELQVNYVVAILITVVCTYILLLRLGAINRTDVHDSLMILPTKIAVPVNGFVDKMAKRMLPTY